jgi:hypothetical protein
MDIFDYKKTGDYLYIITAAIVVDLIVIFLARYPGQNPIFKVKALNDWYEKFGFLAAAADILSLIIGVTAARYLYSSFGLKNSLFFFVIVVVLFQLFHDVFFFLAVITQLPKGENKMIDVFGDYAKENGAKILISDALMMISTTVLAAFLKGLPAHVSASSMILSLYALCFALYTKPS